MVWEWVQTVQCGWWSGGVVRGDSVWGGGHAMLCEVRCVGMGMRGRGGGLGMLGHSRHVPLGSRGHGSTDPDSS